MQVYKVIPSNPNVIMVRNTLAVYGGLTVDTRDVGTLCAKARIGGTAGYAFKIAENGGSDGSLIAGAEPYWNVWSANQPGEWIMNLDLVDFTKSKIIHRLAIYNERYGFDLYRFSGHDIGSKAPSLSGSEEQINAGNTDVSVNFGIVYNFGNYDWRVVDTGHQYYKIVCVKKDYPEIILGQSAVLSVPENDGIGRQSNLPVVTSNNPDSYGTTNPIIGYAKCYLCGSDGSQLVELPRMLGELKLKIVQLSTIVAQIYIDGDISMTNKRTGGIVDNVTYVNDVISFASKKFIDLEPESTYSLQSIKIEVRNKISGSILFTYSRATSASYLDNPKSFDTNIVGQTAIAYEAICDLKNSNFSMAEYGQECTVSYYYNKV